MEAFCLARQDGQDVFIPLLLFAAWCARFGLVPDERAVVALNLPEWQDRVVTPVRAARRSLRDLDAPGDALRNQLKACELSVERHLMEQLAGCIRPTPPSDPPRGGRFRVFQEYCRLLQVEIDAAQAERFSGMVFD